MKPPIINTLEVLDLVQRALKQAKDPTGQDQELFKTALSASSALVPYLKHPEAEVMPKHYEAIQDLYRAMGE